MSMTRASGGPMEEQLANKGFQFGASSEDEIKSDDRVLKYNAQVITLMAEQLAVFQDRGEKYGESWIDEGVDGLIYNILRKVRRLWGQALVQQRNPDRNETLDLANYAVMLAALVEVDPDAIKNCRVKAQTTLFGRPVEEEESHESSL